MEEPSLKPIDGVGAARPSQAGARLDRLPICSFHYRLLLLIGVGLLLDSFDIYVQGAVLAELVRTHRSNPIHNAQFLSVTFGGLALGTVIAGWAGDRWGRRAMYRGNLLVFGLGTLAAALAPSFFVLLLCRFVSGLGMGGEVMTCYVCMAEFVPSSQRGRWQAYLAFISSLGVPLSALASWIIIPRFGWRPVFIAVGILALIAWRYQRNIPESPRWYEDRNCHAEAEAVVERIEKEVEIATGCVLLPLVANSTPEPIRYESWKSLFQGRMLRRTALAILLMVGINIAIYTVTGWIPTILVRHGLNIGNVLGVVSAMQFGALPGSLVGAWICDRWGRRRSLMIFSATSAVMVIAYSMSGRPVSLACNGFALYVLLYGLAAMIFAAYVPEIFPTRLRLTGCGISSGAGRVANVIAPFAVAALWNSFGVKAIYYAVCLVLIAQVIAVAALGEETRGLSLEEIEDMAH